jgi:NAD(P)-dependent dehydrogenase (short-subunit alcohol dehydrogenase family)
MAKQPRSLVGKVVVITGGAQGIGASTATALARLGAKVVIGDLDQVLAEKTAAELGAEALPLDVGPAGRCGAGHCRCFAPSQIRRLHSRVAGHHGQDHTAAPEAGGRSDLAGTRW